jgi:hypothetical protein
VLRMNQASINKRTPLTCPRIESINCRATQSLPRCPDSSSSQERIGTVSAEPSRTRTTRASVTQHWLFKNVGRLALWLWSCLILIPGPNFTQRGTSVSSRIRVTSSAGHTLSTSCSKRSDSSVTDTFARSMSL